MNFKLSYLHAVECHWETLAIFVICNCQLILPCHIIRVNFSTAKLTASNVFQYTYLSLYIRISPYSIHFLVPAKYHLQLVSVCTCLYGCVCVGVYVYMYMRAYGTQMHARDFFTLIVTAPEHSAITGDSSSSSSTPLPVIVGVVIGVVVLCIIVCVVIAVVMTRRKKRKQRAIITRYNYIYVHTNTVSARGGRYW